METKDINLEEYEISEQKDKEIIVLKRRNPNIQSGKIWKD